MMARMVLYNRVAENSVEPWRRVAGWIGLLALAAGLALLPLTWVVVLVFGVSAGILALRWPWLIWLPLAVLLPITSGIRFGPASGTDLLLLTGVTLWFVDGARRRTLLFRWSLVIGLAVVFVATLFVSLFFALDLGEGV
ncbi:MAG TPA: hypothetical protein PLS79_19940, partial [Caldilinea sp.]|nr:hypothetical protein [Caldilinea sp.]